MTRPARWLLLASLGVALASCALRPTRPMAGRMSLTMPDGRTVAGLYRVRWGYPADAGRLEVPLLWQSCPPLSFAGAVRVCGRDTIALPFAIQGVSFAEPVEEKPFANPSRITRTLTFETTCQGHPEYAVALVITESKYRVSFGRGTDLGFRATGHNVTTSTRAKRSFWIGLKKRQGEGDWVLLGGDAGTL